MVQNNQTRPEVTVNLNIWFDAVPKLKLLELKRESQNYIVSSSCYLNIWFDAVLKLKLFELKRESQNYIVSSSCYINIWFGNEADWVLDIIEPGVVENQNTPYKRI